MLLKFLPLLFLVLTAEGFWFFRSRIVCYSHVGCFSNAAPFNNVMGVLPDSPEKIQTTFMLYTRENRESPQVLSPYDSNTISRSNFDTHRSTIFITHGFADTSKTGWALKMKDALLEVDDVNIIPVDWSHGTGFNYMKSSANTRVVGATIGNMLKALWDTTGIQLSRVHLIGQSLGAHIMGYAGDWTRSKINIGSVGRITGLDPAGLHFQGFDIKVKLDVSDASFVDVIHTDAASFSDLGLGISSPNGHVDFYPNGGKRQPGCNALRRVMCSHMRVIDYFIESINSSCEFKAFPCLGYWDYYYGGCRSCRTGCNRMGYHVDKNVHGAFYLKTKAEYPFCVE
ncbi:inactive pancreatic lipase-related protein 1-like [Saccostrea cucullata]|uniref:inactive pancreatic lipase-related protein 1-like n=1 Tax=Saccostrea cuccullata TaxID=36930 RepID=UPI002ECFF640